MSPEFILKEVCDSFSATSLTRDLREAPHDIDIYVPSVRKGDFITWLKEKPYIATWWAPNNHKLFFFAVNQTKIFFFDVTFSFNYISEYFSFNVGDLCDISALDQEKINSILTLKYFLLRRDSEKAVKHVLQHKDILERLPAGDFYKKRMTNKSIENFVRRRPFSYLYLIKPMAYVRFRLRQARSFLGRLNSGKIYAVVGPDGSGKSLVSERLSTLPGTQRRYMGDKDFVTQGIIKYLSRTNILKPFAFVAQVLSQWFRYANIRSLTLLGTTVICDRYPGFNAVNAKNQALYDAIYRWYPRPHKVLFIETSDEELSKRRPELTGEDIQKMKRAVKRRLVENTDVTIKNDGSIDKLITNCLRELHKPKTSSVYENL